MHQVVERPPLAGWQRSSAINNALFWECGPKRMDRRWMRSDDVWAADPGAPNVYPNSATLLRPVSAASASEVVARLRGFYDGDSGASWLLWSPWPDLDFSKHGLQLAGQPPLMVRWPWDAPARIDPPELAIVEVDDAATLQDWLAVLVNGYPLPEFARPGAPVLFDERVLDSALRLWVGYAGGQAVACSAAYADGTTNGIFAVATLPEARGRGYGAAVTDRAASAELALPAMLTASDLGQPVYRKLGFRTAGTFAIWLGQRQQSE